MPTVEKEVPQKRLLYFAHMNAQLRTQESDFCCYFKQKL